VHVAQLRKIHLGACNDHAGNHVLINQTEEQFSKKLVLSARHEIIIKSL